MKGSKVKTEGGEASGKIVIDIRLPKKAEIFSSCKSLSLGKEKENIQSSKSKQQTRRPTPPSKVAQMLSRR